MFYNAATKSLKHRYHVIRKSSLSSHYLSVLFISFHQMHVCFSFEAWQVWGRREPRECRLSAGLGRPPAAHCPLCHPTFAIICLGDALFRMQFQKQSLLVQKGSAVTCQLVESSPPSWCRTPGRPPMAASTSAVCGKHSWGRGSEHSLVGNVFIRCHLCNTDDNYILCPFAPIYDCGENRILKMESSSHGQR